MVKELIPQSEVFVCEVNNNIVGFVGVANGYIAGLFVAEKYQSKGVGRALLDEMKRYNEALTLNVYSKNSKALRFYIREGFKEQSIGIDENTNEQEIKMIWNCYQ